MYHIEDGWEKWMGTVIAWFSRNIVYIKLPFMLFKQVGS